jgi:hypothetical protein
MTILHNMTLDDSLSKLTMARCSCDIDERRWCWLVVILWTCLRLSRQYGHILGDRGRAWIGVHYNLEFAVRLSNIDNICIEVNEPSIHLIDLHRNNCDRSRLLSLITRLKQVKVLAELEEVYYNIDLFKH